MTPRFHPGQASIEIPCGGCCLSGVLTTPPDPLGFVIFAHGSGSGRLSPRNQFVASVLVEGRVGTLLLDLLTDDEADDRRKVFDIELLAERLQCAADWLGGAPEGDGRPLGYFGASTGAAAALVAAARWPNKIAAIVSRGGRPDLAMNELHAVRAPTLLLVGGDDHVVIELNEQAYRSLPCLKEMIVIPGASHLFPEPGALEKVADLALAWFVRHLTAIAPSASTGRGRLRKEDRHVSRS